MLFVFLIHFTRLDLRHIDIRERFLGHHPRQTSGHFASALRRVLSRRMMKEGDTASEAVRGRFYEPIHQAVSTILIIVVEVRKLFGPSISVAFALFADFDRWCKNDQCICVRRDGYRIGDDGGDWANKKEDAIFGSVLIVRRFCPIDADVE